MERSGADTQIKTGLRQHNLLERGNNNCECFIRNRFAQERREALIRLYSYQWFGPQFQELARCCSCPGSNLEGCNVRCETASLP